MWSMQRKRSTQLAERFEARFRLASEFDESRAVDAQPLRGRNQGFVQISRIVWPSLIDLDSHQMPDLNGRG